MNNHPEGVVLDILEEKGAKTPPVILAAFLLYKGIQELAGAVRAIAHGDNSPGGLEGLTMALTGVGVPGTSACIADTLTEIANSVQLLATSNHSDEVLTKTSNEVLTKTNINQIEIFFEDKLIGHDHSSTMTDAELISAGFVMKVAEPHQLYAAWVKDQGGDEHRDVMPLAKFNAVLESKGYRRIRARIQRGGPQERYWVGISEKKD